MLILDPIKTRRMSMDKPLTQEERGLRKLACCVLLHAAKEYRDHPIYSDRMRQSREVIARFIRGEAEVKIWHQVGGFTPTRMARLIEFAEGDVDFLLGAVEEANGIEAEGDPQSIEDELNEVEQRIEDLDYFDGIYEEDLELDNQVA
jgi:hypothetical protein